MTVVLQNMITAAGALRTVPAVFDGYRPRFRKITPSQWVTWKLGDTSDAGTTFRVVGERLCEALELQSGERVLNVTAGNRNTILAAGEKLPFRDSAFDVVTSGFAAMFAPDHFQIAQELLRVCRRGGRIGLTGWTPESFNGQLISTVAKYLTKQSDQTSPTRCGTREYLNDLFGNSADALAAATKTHTWRYRSVKDWLRTWRSYGGPIYDVYRAVDPEWRDQLSAELMALVNRFNEAKDGSVLIRSEYLEFVVHKSIWRV
jgi:SAM-dependent methyltransferase